MQPRAGSERVVNVHSDVFWVADGVLGIQIKGPCSIDTKDTDEIFGAFERLGVIAPTALVADIRSLRGVSLGVRFTPAFIHTAPRWLGLVTLASLVMMAVCAGFAWVLSQMTGLHPATLVLGTSPGGIAEMSITAKVLQLGVPMVTAFQVCRLVAVLILAEPVYRWWARRLSAGSGPRG